MQFTNTIAAAILAFSASVIADQCSSGSKNIGGNWYCQAVDAIQYFNVGTAGSYNQITNMAADGTCTSTKKSFSGPLSPLDEEVSLHFRGPIALKQFASYTLTSKKRSTGRRHNHQQFHKRSTESAPEAPVEKRADMVVATIDGKVVSWENNYFGDAKTTAAAAIAAAATAVASKVVEKVVAAATSAAAAKKTSSVADSSAAYTRSGYYDSASQTLDGLTFLANHGGAGSGVFDTTYGMSLSYVNSAGTGGAASSSILADITVPSNNEFIIMTDTPCANGDCGYFRPGSTAYHGFDGADKVFLFEFTMPLDGNTGFNGDTPAIWMLNAQIPRTLQYGSAACSCWTTGCGEFDIVETLSSGSLFCKSTFHTNTPAGDSDYIVRPTSGTMKLAVIFSSADSSASIQVLPSSTVFGPSLTAAQIATFKGTSAGSLLSTFSISS